MTITLECGCRVKFDEAMMTKGLARRQHEETCTKFAELQKARREYCASVAGGGKFDRARHDFNSMKANIRGE